MNKVPFPKKIPKKLSAHNDVRIDNYYWLRDDARKDKEVIEYLNSENKYAESWFKANNVNSNNIFKYFKNSIPNFEEGIKTRIDNYEYYSTSSLSQEYRKYYRLKGKIKKLCFVRIKATQN